MRLHDQFELLIHFQKISSHQHYFYILHQFKDHISDENQKKVIKSQKQESSLSSSISHPQSCYISRSIRTLHGLHNSLEYIKSGKSQGMVSSWF